MSGGSYNYLYLKLEDDDWRGAIDEVYKMEKRLRETGYLLAADRLQGFIQTYHLCNKLLTMRANDISDLSKVVEWVDSYDKCEEDLIKWCKDNNCTEVT
jgi:hypothetical protein